VERDVTGYASYTYSLKLGLNVPRALPTSKMKVLLFRLSLKGKSRKPHSLTETNLLSLEQAQDSDKDKQLKSRINKWLNDSKAATNRGCLRIQCFCPCIQPIVLDIPQEEFSYWLYSEDGSDLYSLS
jgi:hypothetical protein